MAKSGEIAYLRNLARERGDQACGTRWANPLAIPTAPPTLPRSPPCWRCCRPRRPRCSTSLWHRLD